MNWYRFQKSGFNSPPVVLTCMTMQGLVEYVMYVSQGRIPMSTEGIIVISGTVPGA